MDHSSIESLLDKSSIFSAELHALYLALDRVAMSDDDEKNFIIFPNSKPALQALWGLRLNTFSCPYGVKIPSLANTVPREKHYFSGFPGTLALGVIKRRMRLSKQAY